MKDDAAAAGAPPAAPEIALHRDPAPWRAPLVVFALALLLGGVLTWFLARGIEQGDRATFEAEVAAALDAMKERIDTTVTLLRGTAGLFEASIEVEPGEFAAYVSRLQLRKRYAGVLGIGYTRRFGPGAAEDVLAGMRAHWGPQFGFWPADADEDRHAIVFLEPQDERNRVALGFDMSSEPTRRAAMEAARDSGAPRASGKVTLVQEISREKQAGFLIYLPLYAGRGVPEDVAARREALLGHVYAPLRVGDLLGGAGDGARLRIDFALYDGLQARPEALMLGTGIGSGAQGGPAPRFVAERRLEVEGRPWLLVFSSRPAFEAASQRGLVPAFALLSLAASALAAWITFVQSRERRLAARAANERRANEALLAAGEERERLRSERLERLAGQLRENDRRKDEFLAVLAHELRNPLAPLRTSLEILRIAPEGERARRAREVAERQTLHMVRLIDDLLDLSRISHGTIVLQRRRVALAEVIEAAVETSRPAIEARRHHLRLAPVDPDLQVDGDATRLAQVFSNLLVNAAHYTPPEGEIAVTAGRDGAFVLAAVRDNGIGIAADMLCRVFEAFVREEASGGREGGLGIGLALVRRLVELHGGSVEAASAGRGRGSEFTVCLPLAAPAAQAAPPAQADEAAAAGAPRRILVVDDNRDAADSLAAWLELGGDDIRVAHDGPTALEDARRFRPDAALLDIGMPGMDGYELARRLRALPEGGKLKLVAITGWGQAEDRRRSHEAGFDLHLVKPVDQALLAGHLRRLFGGEPQGGEMA